MVDFKFFYIIYSDIILSYLALKYKTHKSSIKPKNQCVGNKYDFLYLFLIHQLFIDIYEKNKIVIIIKLN